VLVRILHECASAIRKGLWPEAPMSTQVAFKDLEDLNKNRRNLTSALCHDTLSGGCGEREAQSTFVVVFFQAGGKQA
jgi:hypothetical protein